MSGRRRRTHMVAYAEHLAFMREQLSADHVNPQARAYYGVMKGLSRKFVDALKAAEASTNAVREGMLNQTRHDRVSWFEQFYWSLREDSPVLSFPRDVGTMTAFDEIMYVDYDGEPVYIFASRFFNERPIYPKKPREMKDFEHQRQWQPAGA